MTPTCKLAADAVSARLFAGGEMRHHGERDGVQRQRQPMGSLAQDKEGYKTWLELKIKSPAPRSMVSAISDNMKSKSRKCWKSPKKVNTYQEGSLTWRL